MEYGPRIATSRARAVRPSNRRKKVCNNCMTIAGLTLSLFFLASGCVSARGKLW
eukprot:CAMPEP_0184387510 /NCGR_PEP_ID=MMETSP0007-20130409/10804_1 /TAXON_ID=97485 /ORGANISM="Prymnesium parvum, Strain Texoma1" /LENGTH=53 /DNA_ID=CAMNT_0026735937 /DNA_START=145 /DNA_END=306 /DNA_ORIENTATION=+